MPLVSVQFLIFIFFVTVFYFTVPKKWQWGVLLAGSYIYYFINSEWLILVLFAETLVTFGTGLCLEKQAESERIKIDALKESGTEDGIRDLLASGGKKRKRIMLCGVLTVLLTLVFLKYYNFFAENISYVTRHFGIAFPKLYLLLPVGISFYSLQAIAYMVDVYHGKIHADTSLPKFMLFMSYFPQILQGPIPRHKQLAGQLYEGHAFDFQRLCYGVQLILWGFMKKKIIADRATIPVNTVFDDPGNYRGLIIFFAAVLYYLQLYTDFSAGIDIARGFSQIIGIDLELNFTQPFFSVSVKDFWHRWHISLSTWLRDYVYIPLGGNRKGKFRQCVNILITFLISGIWHGSQWKYAVFGVCNGIFIVSGILFKDPILRLKQLCRIDDKLFSWRLFQMIRTFVIISFGSFFYRAVSLKTTLSMIRNCFTRWYSNAFLFDGTLNTLGIGTADWVLLLIMVFLLVAVDFVHEKGFRIRGWITTQGPVFELFVFLAAVTAVMILGVYGPSFNAANFLYQQF